MLKTAIAVLFIVTTLLIAGCGKGPSVLDLTSVGIGDSYDLSVGITIGNHTYFPINRELNLSDPLLAEDILTFLAAFEKSNSNFEVTGWRVEKQQKAKSSNDKMAYIFGIWIDHRPKIVASTEVSPPK